MLQPHNVTTYENLEQLDPATSSAMEERNKYEHNMPSLVLQNQENDYEMLNFSTNARRDDVQPTETTPNKKASEQTTWSRPLLVIAALQCLMVFLLLAILSLLLMQLFAGDVISTNCTSASTSTAGGIAGNIVFPNFTEWSDNIVNKVHQSLPDFNEWANGVVSKVNSNVTGSLPDVAQNTFQLLQSFPNFTELDEQILQTTRDSAQKLINIVNTLSNIQDTSTSTAGVVDDILLIAQELLVLHNESTALPTSCKQLQGQQPNSPSGYYILAGSTNGIYTAYCNMGSLCGSGGGWTRLAYLDMTDATQNCPSGFSLYQSGGVRACGKQTLDNSCVSVQFSSHNINYSQVCGRVTGYSYGSIDALNTRGVDFEGVSITRGSFRQKVWSFIAGNREVGSSTKSCPCNNGSSVYVPASIGNNYFCESGVPGPSSPSQILYTSDPLWDGQGCGSDETACCNVPGIPWFHRDYGNTTTDYIELSLCTNHHDEDSPVSYYEIYVK